MPAPPRAAVQGRAIKKDSQSFGHRAETVVAKTAKVTIFSDLNIEMFKNGPIRWDQRWGKWPVNNHRGECIF